MAVSPLDLACDAAGLAAWLENSEHQAFAAPFREHGVDGPRLRELFAEQGRRLSVCPCQWLVSASAGNEQNCRPCDVHKSPDSDAARDCKRLLVMLLVAI